MNIIYLLFHGLSPYSGISKKILHQVKGFEACGHRVSLCTYSIADNGHRVRMINNEIIEDYGTGKPAAAKRRVSYQCIYRYAITHQVELIYVRSFHNANPFTIRLFSKLRKAGIKIAMEIPTYPYDSEYAGFPLVTRLGIQVDKVFRKTLAKHVNAIVTFSDYHCIFGQRTIQISNGVDFDSIPLKKTVSKNTSVIHLLGVAEVHYWHGYDRLIEGLGKYYQNPANTTVFFHIAGGIWKSEMHDSQHAPGFYELINKYHIEKYVIFHGQKMNEELDELFNEADFAIGSLARHRSGIDKIKTLKNREYAARGISFAYSETDEDFEETLDVVRKARYDSAFTFIYSKRSGTPAATMPDQVPEDVVKERFDRLLNLVNEISREKTKHLEGTVQSVLVEELNKKIPGYVTGRLSNNSVVHFEGCKELIGKIVDVNLKEAKGFYYMGTKND